MYACYDNYLNNMLQILGCNRPLFCVWRRKKMRNHMSEVSKKIKEEKRLQRSKTIQKGRKATTL